MSQRRATLRRGSEWRTLILLSCTLSMALFAGVSSTEKVSYTATAALLAATPPVEGPSTGVTINVARSIVFTAAPLDSTEHARDLYTPITEYLSIVTGKQVIYRPPGNWLAYQRDMRNGDYDLVFDNPQFASWRITRLAHEPLVRMAGRHAFLVLVRRDGSNITQLQDLAGRRVCAPAAPSQPTLSLYSQFDNPARQPVLLPVDGWQNIYQVMIDGVCDAAIMPTQLYNKVDPGGKQTRILFKTMAMPAQTLTAGPRLSRHEKALIRRALLSAQGQDATKTLRARFHAEKMISASKREYAGLDALLQNTWGFDI